MPPHADPPGSEPVPTPIVLACAACTTTASTAAVTTFATADLFGLPRADEISEAATHAPSASFQIERYERFIRNGLRGLRNTGALFV
ncbi:hypothetical protein X963_2393 [Burkholderia pseudomallei MSHR7498]|nr:hypothetical protein M218_23265 [Burkholderia pseudomallei MSHR338]KGC37574.1 hypothetical protein DO62_5047 [Burkholderia pseudomallei]KGR99530.1 hypothetical protein X977_4954 [Burkholderia pseudomallei MSHR7504]KGS01756.1 hypothetical protein X948_3055 [Burkholderia pseudomallei MSHR5608]KGS17833.1 hypothetical protein X989_4978 [Burkholderia pseudomallei MSHR4378]KGS23547.1 hypothetical protein X941_5195 [Burkholderia pseudomallei MSHR5569]KGS24165.1 hypothetical protein X962_4949 [Bur